MEAEIRAEVRAEMEAEVQAEVERRTEAEVERRTKKVRRDCERKIAAAKRRADEAARKLHSARCKTLSLRVTAYRARQALGHIHMRRPDGRIVRAQRVTVRTGGKRRCIQHQWVLQDGALQPREMGGTQYTLRDLGLAYMEDKALGLGSRKSASAKGNARDTRRQQQVHALFCTKSGRRRLKDGEGVDVFVRPSETVMVYVRRAVHLLSCCAVRKAAKEADGINITTDGKTFIRKHGVGANAVFVRMIPDPSEQDAFGDCAMKRHQLRIRTPMLQQASHATGVTSRKTGGTHAKCNQEAFIRMLVLADLDRGVRENKHKVTVAMDAASDNRGKGKNDQTYANMCGRDGLMEGTMIEEDGWVRAEEYLRSLGLYEATKQLFDGRDLEGLIMALRAERAKRRRKDRAAARARRNIILNLETKAEQAANAAAAAEAEAARCATEASRLKTADAKALKRAADEAADAAKVAAREAKRNVMEAKRRAAPQSGSSALVPPAPAERPSPSQLETAAPQPGSSAPVPAAGAYAGDGAPPAPAERPSPSQLDTSGPVMKCPEEMERLDRCTIYEVRLRPVLKRQRFWRWILRLWRYKALESLLMKEFESTVSPRASEAVKEQRRIELLDLNRRIERSEVNGTIRAMRLIGPVEPRALAAKRYADRERNGMSCITQNAQRVGRGWLSSDHGIAYVRRKTMKAIDAWGKALYGRCDEKGKAIRDWRKLHLSPDGADNILLSSVQTALNKVLVHAQMDVEGQSASADESLMSRYAWPNFLPSSRLEKKLGNDKADETLLQALEAVLAQNSEDPETQMDHLVHQSNLFRSTFWMPRPTVPRDRSLKKTYPDVVSMRQNPARIWPCIDMCSICGAQRNETGVACHCSNHRLHNMSKRLFRTMDGEFMNENHSLATAMHNPELGDRVLDNIPLFLDPWDNEDSDYHKLVMKGTIEQHEQGKGVDVQEIVKGCSGDPAKAMNASNPCRWGSGMMVCVDASEREDLLAAGVLRQKAVGKTEEAEIAAAVAIFSNDGWNSSDHQDLVVDSERVHLFLSLVKPQAREQRYMAAFLHDILFHPLFAVISDDDRSANMMMGMGGVPRQLLFILANTIWVSTAPREMDWAIGCRTDNAEVRFNPLSLRLLNPACGPAVRKALRDEWGKSPVLEPILERVVGAVPLLLQRLKRLAKMKGSVLPDTTRQIVQAMPGHCRLYGSDGKLMDPPSLMDLPSDRRLSVPMEESFAIKMAQLQFHLRIIILDAIHEVRDAFAREMLGPAAFAAGMNAERWTQGTVNGKRILHAQPWALANAAVMRVMGRDTMSCLKKQLNTKSTGKHPLDFLPPVAFMWGPKGTRSCSAFAGMARGGNFEYDETHTPVEPLELHGLPISIDATNNHFKSVVSLNANDESGQPICRVLSRDRELEHFPKSLQHFPFAKKLAVSVQVSASSSKDIEQPWARTGQLIETRNGATFETLSGFFTANNDEGMGIDVLQVVENNPLLFRAALEVAKIPGFKTLFKTDTASRDAIYADLRFSQAAKKRAPFWHAIHHNQRSHRGDRWLNPTQAEVNAVANQIQRTRQRLGFLPLPTAQVISRGRALPAARQPGPGAQSVPLAVRRRTRGVGAAGQGEKDAELSGAAPAAASSTARSASARAAASAAALGTSVAGLGCAESITAGGEVSSAVGSNDEGATQEEEMALHGKEAAERSTIQEVGSLTVPSPAAASIIDGRDMVSITPSAADGSAVAAMDVDVVGKDLTELSAVQAVSSSAALSPHVDMAPSTAALATPLGNDDQLVLGKRASAGDNSEDDDEWDQPLFRRAVLSARDTSAQNGSQAGVAGGGKEGPGGSDATGDKEDISDSDEDSDDQFEMLAVDENKWSLQYLYDVFQGLRFSCDVWKDSMVTFNKVGKLTVHVTRRPTDRLLRYLSWIDRDEDPKASFTVYSNSGTLLYARRCNFGGIQLVHVIGLDEPREDDWSETMRFVRLFPTMDAITNCESETDNGQFLGKKALRKFWKSVNHSQKGDVYHLGDVDFKGDVRELIGVARWYPFRRENPAASYFTECKSADLVYMGPSFRLKIAGRGNTKGISNGADGGGACRDGV
jgi:hypothetical protein